MHCSEVFKRKEQNNKQNIWNKALQQTLHEWILWILFRLTFQKILTAKKEKQNVVEFYSFQL